MFSRYPDDRPQNPRTSKWCVADVRSKSELIHEAVEEQLHAVAVSNGNVLDDVTIPSYGSTSIHAAASAVAAACCRRPRRTDLALSYAAPTPVVALSMRCVLRSSTSDRSPLSPRPTTVKRTPGTDEDPVHTAADRRRGHRHTIAKALLKSELIDPVEEFDDRSANHNIMTGSRNDVRRRSRNSSIGKGRTPVKRSISMSANSVRVTAPNVHLLVRRAVAAARSGRSPSTSHRPHPIADQTNHT